jgi:integrase
VRRLRKRPPDRRRSRLRKWREAFGDRGAWDIDRDTFTRAGEAMTAAGYSPSSVNRDLSAIGGMYRWAHDVRKITPPNFRSPTRDIRRAKEAMRVVTLSADEEHRLRSLALATRDRRFGLFVSLMLDTGARPGEILERAWSELDIELQEILLPEEVTKTGRRGCCTCEHGQTDRASAAGG